MPPNHTLFLPHLLPAGPHLLPTGPRQFPHRTYLLFHLIDVNSSVFYDEKTHYISNTFKSYVCAQKLIKIIISYGTIRMSIFCIKFIAPKSKENKTIELKEYRFNEMNDYCLVLFYHTYAIVEYLQKLQHITMNIFILDRSFVEMTEVLCPL